MAGSTGQGTSVAFTEAANVACVRSITLPTWSMETIDSSCLSDTGFGKKIVGDLVDAGSVQITAVMELTGEPYTPDGTNDTITITFACTKWHWNWRNFDRNWLYQRVHSSKHRNRRTA